MSNGLTTEKTGKALIVRFCRPEIRSPLSVHVLEALDSVLEHETGDEVSTVIFTGMKDVFASGADLREIAEVTGTTAPAFAMRGQQLFTKIASSTQLTIAAVNGFCFGGALDLALACDQRIASPNALFSHPGGELGIMTGWGGTQRLPRLVGEAMALEMFLTGKRVNAAEAVRIGLVGLIDDDPLAAALKITESGRDL